VPESVKSSEAFAELMWLKLLKRVKGKQNLLGPVVHYGFACDRCGMEPISGTRWHCPQCPASTSIDFCSQCVNSLTLKTGHHQPNHKLTPIINSESIERHQGPNYLQSNFMAET